MHFLYFYRRVKAWTEAHFFYEARFIQNVLRSTLSRFIQNVLRSTLLHANTTTKKCIQFLNKRILVTGILAWLSLQTSSACANVTERCTFDSEFSCHNLASLTVDISGCRFFGEYHAPCA